MNLIIFPVVIKPRRLYTIDYALLREHPLYFMRVDTGCQLLGRRLVNLLEASCFTVFLTV